jgi:hypothetical protein
VEHSEPGANHDISRGVLDDEYRCVHFFGNDLLMICRLWVCHSTPPASLAPMIYGVRARIVVDGTLWFIDYRPDPVLTRGDPGGAKVLVRPAAEG